MTLPDRPPGLNVTASRVFVDRIDQYALVRERWIGIYQAHVERVRAIKERS